MSHQSHEQSAAGITVRFAVLTLSDTRTPDTDESGKAIRALIRQAHHAVVAQELIRDDPAALRAILERWLTNEVVDAVITTGGTGVSRRDHTMPVIQSLIDTPLPGFGELFRALSFRDIGAAAMLSRAEAGIARGKLLVALPGSTNAVSLALRELILPQSRHLISELRK